MNNIKDYEKIVKYLVKKSFPSLKGIKIRIKEKKVKRGSMLAFRFLNKYFIIVDPIVKKSPKKSLKAFAHKLAHLENFRKKSYIRLIIYFLKYYSNKKFRKKEERNTDRITILKGYGRELLIYREFIKRVIKKDKRIYNNYKRISKNYLSEKEIEGYLKKRYKTKKSLTIKINS